MPAPAIACRPTRESECGCRGSAKKSANGLDAFGVGTVVGRLTVIIL